MNKNMFPSLIKSLISPNKKRLNHGIHLSMSTTLHSEGNISINFMGLEHGDVKFILKAISELENTVFIPPQNGINWLQAASELYTIIPKDKNSAPAFKQFFSYLSEAMESKNIEDMKKIAKILVEIIFIKDLEDNNVSFLLPEDIETVQVPSGVKKKYYC